MSICGYVRCKGTFAQCAEFSGVVCGPANPHKIVRTADSCFGDKQRAGVYSDRLLDLIGGVWICGFDFWVEDLRNDVVDLERGFRGGGVFSIADVYSHHTVAIERC